MTYSLKNITQFSFDFKDNEFKGINAPISSQ